MYAKKSLGQNFLISPAPIRRMLEEAKVKTGDTVLEIGPGKGILTSSLLGAGAKVIAIEKDNELIPLLSEKFKEEIKNGKLTLICDDIVNFKFEIKNYKLIANIPYYLTGEIIRLFLTSENQPESISLLLQKEVVERIVAKNGKESILSISVKVYGVPKYLGTVKKGLFRPIPNVDSALLYIDRISKDFFKDLSENRFFEIVKLGFAHKRKKLISNLKELSGNKNIEKIFSDLKIDTNTRAEELTLSDWKSLTKSLGATNLK